MPTANVRSPRAPRASAEGDSDSDSEGEVEVEGDSESGSSKDEGDIHSESEGQRRTEVHAHDDSRPPGASSQGRASTGRDWEEASAHGVRLSLGKAARQLSARQGTPDRSGSNE